MSKAFTREVDDTPDRPVRTRQRSGLPAGATNYMTAEGARRFRSELDRLLLEERPRVMRIAESSEAPCLLQQVDRKIAEIQQILSTAVVPPPVEEPISEVRFGTTVTVRVRGGHERRLRIVGGDEADAARGWVSWFSPAGRALLNRRVGERVQVPFPEGAADAEVLRVEIG